MVKKFLAFFMLVTLVSTGWFIKNVEAAPNCVEVIGSLEKWKPLTLSIQGPSASQSDNDPNPFLDYRLTALFKSPTGNFHRVPGYFDGDGEGGAEGNIWKVRFSPDELGHWFYRVNFHSGDNIAIDLDLENGIAIDPNGARGSFDVEDISPNATGFYPRGRLEYEPGSYYLKFREGENDYFLKTGANSPENMLGSAAFPDTTENFGVGSLHFWQAHEQDGEATDPFFESTLTDSVGLFGALNYLSSKKVNSIYFLPMNIGGDAQDTWPYLDPIDPNGDSDNDNVHFNLNKLKHWDLYFEHAQKKGIFLHFVLNEAEPKNKQELDGATLGVERKLFYREMIARYGHHLALQWNVCEEYNLSLNLGFDKVIEFATYIKDMDPYDHPVAVHNAGSSGLDQFVGNPNIQVLSYQDHLAGKGDKFEVFQENAAEAGYTQITCFDEPARDPYSFGGNSFQEYLRCVVWPTLISRSHFEMYTKDAIQTSQPDQGIEDFREFEEVFEGMWYARKFIQMFPFWEMKPNDDFVSGSTNQAFEKEGEICALYLPNGGNQDIDTSGFPNGTTLIVDWYNPRTGKFEESSEIVSDGGFVELGAAPSNLNWAVRVKSKLTATASRPKINPGLILK